MSVDFILPDIGEGIVECELVEWRIKEGDVICEDQPVADVSTDKALVEITSMHNGRVDKLYYQQGDIAKVHKPLFSIDVDSNSADGGAGHGNDSNGPNGDDGGRQTAQADNTPPAATTPLSAEHSATLNPVVRRDNKVLTTPAVRRIARDNNVDLTAVPATGKNGRVLKEDVVNFLQQRNAAASPQTEPQAPATEAALTEDRIEPIRGVRAVMAKTMTESVASIPHFTYVDEVDMSRLIALRAELKADLEQQGIRLTMMPFFIKALSLAIKRYPILNSRVNDDCTELHYLAGHHIGMAVDSPAGLLVPNIKNVQDLTIIDIAQHSNRLTEQARAGRLSPDDLRGGTITLSNVGAIGGTAATPIINKPEVAIVALGKVQSLPRFDADGNVCARQIMTISWSGDHRVIDGATMARFSNEWKAYLENPSTMLMAMN